MLGLLLTPFKLLLSISVLTNGPDVPVHTKCRGPYPLNDQIKRFTFSDSQVNWDVEFNLYAPVNYTAEAVKKKPVWADPDLKLAFF